MNKKIIFLLFLIFIVIVFYFMYRNNISFNDMKSEDVLANSYNEKDFLDNLGITNFTLEAEKDFLDDIDGKMSGIHYRLSFKSKSLQTDASFVNMTGFELYYRNQTQIDIGKTSSGINHSKLITTNILGSSTYTVDFYEYGNSFSDDIINKLILNAKNDIDVMISIKDKPSRLIKNVTYNN